jgi:hypothetical protein
MMTPIRQNMATVTKIMIGRLVALSGLVTGIKTSSISSVGTGEVFG